MKRSWRNLLLLVAMLATLATPAIVYAVNFDNDGKAMEVSLYGKQTVAGDTALVATSAGSLNVNVTGSSGTASTNVAQFGGQTVTAGAGGVGVAATGVPNFSPMLRRNSDGTLSSLADSLSLGDNETGLRFPGTSLMAWDGTTYDRVSAGDVNNVAAATGYLDTLSVGRYNVTLPTLTDTRYNALQVTSRGGLIIQPRIDQSAVADGQTGFPGRIIADDNGVINLQVLPLAFNGTSWDRIRTSAISTGRLLTVNENSFGRVTGDGQVKATAGHVHTVTIAPTTATPTAGLVTVYDSASESGTAIFSTWVFATDPAKTIVLDVNTSTGIYVGYDGTLANVSVTVSYR